MAFFRDSLSEITAADIRALVAGEGDQESSELEFKRFAIPTLDAFMNKLARAVVAFAAADGGTIVLGIDERSGSTNRAGSIEPAAVSGSQAAAPGGRA